MARPVTYKTIQVHQECSCGLNEVEQVELQIRFKDLKAHGIRYKKCKSTGQYLFFKHAKYDCQGHDQ